MARSHPEFSQALPLARTDLNRLSPARFLCMLVFNWPTVGDAFATILRVALDFMEKARLHRSWRQLSTILHKYWYWKGVTSQFETLQKLRETLEEVAVSSRPSASLTELDLSNGLENAEERLDKERPEAIRIRFGGTPVGVVLHQPGAEALRGIHLRSLLSNFLTEPLLHAMALEGKITCSKNIDRLKLSKSIRARSRWFGPIQPGEMWFEQYSQWSELQKKDSDRDLALKEHRDRLISLEHETAWLEGRRLNWEAISRKADRLKRLMGYWIFDGFALWIAIQLVPGMNSPEGFIKLLLTLFLFGTMSAFIRPLLTLLSFPLLVITVGPLLLLLNALLILFCATLADSLGLGFVVEGLGSALMGAVTVIVARLLIAEFARRGRRKLVFRKEQSWILKLEKRRIRLEEQIANTKNADERDERTIHKQKPLADVVKNKITPHLSAEEE
jgi:putative membrane protein